MYCILLYQKTFNCKLHYISSIHTKSLQYYHHQYYYYYYFLEMRKWLNLSLLLCIRLLFTLCAICLWPFTFFLLHNIFYIFYMHAFITQFGTCLPLFLLRFSFFLPFTLPRFNFILDHQLESVNEDGDEDIFWMCFFRIGDRVSV